jgi:tetratricopeptide (TPR) repeat protein
MLAALALLVLAQTSPSPQPAAQRFQAGVEAYRAGDHQAASSLWRGVLEEHGAELDPGLLCYDLGNAAFRAGRVLESVGWYTASLRYDPRSQAAWANLELARQRAGLDPADRGDLADTLRRLGTALTIAEIEWTLVALAALVCVAILAEAWFGGVALRRVAWTFAGSAVLCAGLWTWRLASEGGPSAFVTQSEGAVLHSEPRADAAAVGRADAAEIVARLDELPGWVRVRTAENVHGWTEATAVLELPDPKTE